MRNSIDAPSPEKVPERTRTITLTITDADDDGVWVVSDDVSTVYGEHVTVPDAIRDWLSTLQAHYLGLLKNQDTLGPSLKEELRVIDGEFWGVPYVPRER